MLGGCATRTAPDFPVGGDFSVTGKMAVLAPQSNVSARFHWAQTGPRYDLELWGPFGQGRHRLSGNDQYVSLLDGRGQLLLRGPVGQVMQEQLGFELPLKALAHWIQGRPDPTGPVTSLRHHADGAVAGFDQASWEVMYPSYTKVTGRGLLPQRIEATNHRYRIKLAISRWEV